MGELIRKVVVGVITGACLVLWVLLASAVWDYNENTYDAEMDRFYAENPAPSYCWSDIYAGVKKTKVVHILGSDCAKQIIPGDMVIFLSKEEAKEAGYSPCRVCKPFELDY